jgi:hypothetical protein
MKEEKNEREKIIEIAEKVKLLFGFCADLIKDKEQIKKTMELAYSRVENSLAVAPILGSFGEDYRDTEFEARLHAKRAEALFNLIDCLEKTENERLEYKDKQNARSAGLAQLHRMLGI